VLNERTPIWASESFPEGVTQIYALFDYRGLRDGQIWRAEWIKDGAVLDIFTTEKPWSGGGTGTFWVKAFSDKGLNPGDWEFRLYLDGKLQQTAQFTIELNPTGKPAFGPITFARDQKGDAPVDPVPARKPEFPAGTQQLYAFFDAINVPKGTTWARQWFRNDKAETDQVSEDWSGGPNENYWARFGTTDNTPLAAGVYVLEITIDDRLVSVGSFVIAPATAASAQPAPTARAAATPNAEAIVFGAGLTGQWDVVDPRNEFPGGITRVYAIFRGQDFPDGATWRTEWIHNGKVQADLGVEGKWDTQIMIPERKAWSSVFNDKQLAAGEWTLNVYINGALKRSGRFTVEPPPAGQPGFTPITFAPDKDAQGKPVNPIPVGTPTMPAGVKQVYAFFNGINVSQGANLTAHWNQEGKTNGTDDTWTWDGTPNGDLWVSCTATCFGKTDGDPFDPGVYELVMRIEGRDAALGTFIVPK
jgi:hypothetical protein